MLVAVFSLSLIFVSSPLLAQPGEPKEPVKEKKLFDANEVIFGHIMDAHEFHFLSYKDSKGEQHSWSIPLPVIVYSKEKGFACFMSSKFEEGKQAYKGYGVLTNEIIDELKLDLARALYATGEMQEAVDLLREAAGSDDDELSARACFLSAVVECHMGAAFAVSERRVLERLAGSEEAGASATALAEGYLAYAELLFWNGRTSELVDAGRTALAHAIRAGDTVLEVGARTKIGVGVLYGPARWTEVEAHARAAREEEGRRGAQPTGEALAPADEGGSVELRDLHGKRV